VKYSDVVCINRYYGWYYDTGHLETIKYTLSAELTDWYQHYQRPVIVTEYGADTVVGLHSVRIFITLLTYLLTYRLI